MLKVKQPNNCRLARFLRRRKGKTGRKIIKECPDIGRTTEDYVKSTGVGADCWRTGVLTLNGHRGLQKW